MARFFIEGSPGTEYTISGEDGRHIARSLRMRVGETLTLCDGCGQDFTCEITAISGDDVTVSVLHQQVNPAEPTLQVTVYQGLPKSDKMDWIAQKIVESGAVRLVPVMTTRCISRPDGKAAEKKVQRWQKIAEEAAKQSGRGIIPQVAPLTEFAKAVEEASQQGAVFFFYEGGGDNLKPCCKNLPKPYLFLLGRKVALQSRKWSLPKRMEPKSLPWDLVFSEPKQPRLLPCLP